MPELQLKAQLSRAKLFEIISVRNLLQEPVNRQMQKLRNDIQTTIEEDASLEKAARKAWMEVCGTFLMDKKSGLWIEVKPLALRTAQPIVDDKNARLQLVFDAETRVVTGKTHQQCNFPKSLIIDPPRPGKLLLVLPAHASYDWLSELLNERVKREIDVEGVYLQIKDIGVRPHGDSLLLEVNLAAQTGGWFATRGEGKIYIVAKPVLDESSQTIVLSNLGLDTESRNVLVSVLGELVEPVLLDLLSDNSTIDLKPKLQEIRAKAQKVFEAVSRGGFSVEGQVETIELERIDVGRDNLRIVSRMTASISGTMLDVQVGR